MGDGVLKILTFSASASKREGCQHYEDNDGLMANWSKTSNRPIEMKSREDRKLKKHRLSKTIPLPTHLSSMNPANWWAVGLFADEVVRAPAQTMPCDAMGVCDRSWLSSLFLQLLI